MTNLRTYRIARRGERTHYVSLPYTGGHSLASDGPLVLRILANYLGTTPELLDVDQIEMIRSDSWLPSVSEIAAASDPG